LPVECIDTLKRLWAPEHPEWLRQYAFKFWIRFSADALWATDLPNDLSESDDAIVERAQRGDTRVTTLVIERIPIHPHWSSLIRYIWAEEFEPVLDAALRNSDWWAIHVLRDVPGSVAERLVVANWNAIHNSSEAVQAALYIANEPTIALASAELSRCPNPAEQLVHVDHLFRL
jgi:hypothetical protein